MADPNTSPIAAAAEIPVEATSTPFYADKSFWLTLLGPICAGLAAKYGLQLDAGALAAVVVGVAGAIATFVHASKKKQSDISVAKITGGTNGLLLVCIVGLSMLPLSGCALFQKMDWQKLEAREVDCLKIATSDQMALATADAGTMLSAALNDQTCDPTAIVEQLLEKWGLDFGACSVKAVLLTASGAGTGVTAEQHLQVSRAYAALSARGLHFKLYPKK